MPGGRYGPHSGGGERPSCTVMAERISALVKGLQQIQRSGKTGKRKRTRDRTAEGTRFTMRGNVASAT